jgi:ribose 5-phosphate isomerase B
MIAIGSDHAGVHLKREIVKYLKENNYEFQDFGVCDETSVDYPDYGLIVAEAIKTGICDKGILICGTGIGISISANKVPGIRAAVCSESFSARASREHNDSNILALGERVVGVGLALEVVEVWLKTQFLGGRHKIRVDKITEIERKFLK